MYEEITLRVSAECVDLTPLWDSIITQNGDLQIDWALASPSEGVNYGGLQATQALPTAIAIILWTDKWCDANEVKEQQDRRGWWGDGVDTQGFPELGNEIWSLFRGRLSAQTAILARNYVRGGLQTLIDQGAVADVQVQANADIPNSSLFVNIQCFSETGTTVYQQRWGFVWDEVGRIKYG